MILLQVVDIPLPSGETGPIDLNTPKLTFDPEWLAITRAFHPFMTRRAEQIPFPAEGLARQMVKDEIEWVIRNVGNNEGSINVLDYQQFVKTAPGPGNEGSMRNRQRMWAFQNVCSRLISSFSIIPRKPPDGGILPYVGDRKQGQTFVRIATSSTIVDGLHCRKRPKHDSGQVWTVPNEGSR